MKTSEPHLDRIEAVHFPQSEAEGLLIEVAPEDGTLSAIRIGTDDAMNWIGFHGRWGEPSVRNITLKPSEVKILDDGVYTTWSSDDLVFEIQRRPSEQQGYWAENYRVRNCSNRVIAFEDADIGIRVPFADDYKSGARACLTSRCHAHLWAEGNSAWMCALRMNGKAPHLGVLLTRGALHGYSIVDREWNSNDRGAFVVHPAIATLAPGEEIELQWTIFAHKGWDDFFLKARSIDQGFIQLKADRYAVPVNDPIHFTAESASSLEKAVISVNGIPIPGKIETNNQLSWSFVASEPGELNITVQNGARIERLVALAVPEPEGLLHNRAAFLMNRKQVRDPGDQRDGAFPVLDLDTGEIVTSTKPDHNCARERMGSGVMLGLLWEQTAPGRFRDRLQESFLRYYAFLNREIQSPDGLVHNDIGYSGRHRLYNAPWAVASHICAWQMTHDSGCLERMMRNLRTIYGMGGKDFYFVGMPVEAALRALKEADMHAEYDETLQFFRIHAASIIEKGIDIPGHEVAYEQSIMAPAVQFIAELACVTGDPDLCAAVATFLPMLEVFGGRQPHYRLYDIAIRHWDGYWFGKPRPGGCLYGDTMPHYWSTLTAEAFRLYSKLANETAYQKRAQQILLANFSHFRSDGAGSCAYLYPHTVNGLPAQYADPYDNDQDWALVNYLRFDLMFQSPE